MEKIWMQNVPFRFPVSYSQIESYLDCPRKYYYKYIHRPKFQEKTNLALHIGNGMHAALEDFYTEIKAGSKPGMDFLTERYGKYLWEEIAKNWETTSYYKNRFQFVSDTDWDGYIRTEQVQAFETGNALFGRFVRDYYGKQYPRWQPVHMEYKFSKFQLIPEHQAAYPGINSTQFVGFIDLIEVDTVTGVHRIVDHKTSRSFDEDKIHHNMQLTMYAYVAKYELKLDARSVGYQVFQTIPGKPTVSWKFGDRSEAHINEMLRRLNETLPCMKFPQYYKRPSDDACKYCPVADPCLKGEL